MQPEYTERFMHPKMEFYRECYKDSERWDGEQSLSNKHVVVYGEQGLGDIIQFSRYLPLLKATGCKITVHCPIELHNLFLQNMNCVDQCLDKREWKLPKHDFHIPSMSLPFLLGTHETDMPCFFAEGDCLEDFKNDFKIGIAWEGNPEHSNNSDRCCPLSIFRYISKIENVKLFMIQPSVSKQSLVEGCDDIDLFSMKLNDFSDTAKLIQSLDYVISVDTSVMHLAGSLGKKGICLLSNPSDPRWDVGVNWYPSLKVMNQKTQGDWMGLMKEMNVFVSMELQRWKIKNRVKS